MTSKPTFELTDVAAVNQSLVVSSSDGVSISQDGGTSWKPFSTKQGLASNSAFGVALAGSSIYVATNAGLSVLNPTIPVK
jgi:hypothetical protein